MKCLITFRRWELFQMQAHWPTSRDANFMTADDLRRCVDPSFSSGCAIFPCWSDIKFFVAAFPNLYSPTLWPVSTFSRETMHLIFVQRFIKSLRDLIFVENSLHHGRATAFVFFLQYFFSKLRIFLSKLRIFLWIIWTDLSHSIMDGRRRLSSDQQFSPPEHFWQFEEIGSKISPALLNSIAILRDALLGKSGTMWENISSERGKVFLPKVERYGHFWWPASQLWQKCCKVGSCPLPLLPSLSSHPWPMTTSLQCISVKSMNVFLSKVRIYFSQLWEKCCQVGPPLLSLSSNTLLTTSFQLLHILLQTRGYCPACTSSLCVKYMMEDGLCLT